VGLNHPRSNVYFAAAGPEDADVIQRGCGLLAGVAMVALQCMVVVGVVLGSASPACSSSDQCQQAGMFCEVGGRNRCVFCGTSTPLPAQTDPATGGALNDPNAADFVGFNLTAVAELCADPSLLTTDLLMQHLGHLNWHTVSSVVSWCKFRNWMLLVFFIP
jgi:hypothetical protein